MHKLSRWKTIAIGIWFLFTVSLASWWLVFGLRQTARLHELAGAAVTAEANRAQRMLLMEGSTLLVSVLLGCLGLVYLAFREAKKAREVKEFLATFTHELKTPLANIQLQAQILADDPQASLNADTRRRLLEGVGRLNLMLENSLLLAQGDASNLQRTETSLAEVIRGLAVYWPRLSIIVEGEDAVLFEDRRALEAIFANLLQNSASHGKATQVRVITTADPEPRVVRVRVIDNGVGFSGDTSKLGVPFFRHTTSSGSGVGLNLVQRLMRVLGGESRIVGTSDPSQGFEVQLLFRSCVA